MATKTAVGLLAAVLVVMTGTAPASSTPGKLRVSATIPVGRHASGLAVAGGSVWVSNDLDNTVSRIDPESNTVLATIKLQGRPYPAPEIAAVGLDSVWIIAPTTGAVPSTGLVSRIDPETGETLATSTVPGRALGIAFAAGAAWVTSFDVSRLNRLDAESNKVSGRFRVHWPSDVVAGYGTLWIVNHRAAAVSIVNVRTGRVTRKIDIRLGSEKSIYEGPERIETGFGAVWVTHPSQDTLTRIDSTTKKIVARIRLPRDSFAIELAIGAGSVWALGPKQVFRIDPRTNRVTDSARIGRHPGSDFRGLRQLVVSGDTLWVTDADADAVHRIELRG